jgi:hypothetical protein
MWEKVFADINSKLGFKQPAAAWSVLRGLRRNIDDKTHIELITLNDWTRCYEKLLNEDREEFKDWLLQSGPIREGPGGHFGPDLKIEGCLNSKRS